MFFYQKKIAGDCCFVFEGGDGGGIVVGFFYQEKIAGDCCFVFEGGDGGGIVVLFLKEEIAGGLLFCFLTRRR